MSIPVPKGHRPRPHARITPADKRIARDYLACKGDVESVLQAHAMSRSGLHYVLAKVGVWKRWVASALALPRCGLCRRPVSRAGVKDHAACRRKVRAAETARVLKRARKLLAAGWTARATAAKVGRSAVYLSKLLPGVALTNEQRRRRGLPPAKKQPRAPTLAKRRRSLAQRNLDWVLVRVPVPPSLRGKPPERLDALERRAVKGYLACHGDVEPVARALGRSSAWLRVVLMRAQVWWRWKKRPAVRPPCTVCGRPLPYTRNVSRHQACWRKEMALRRKAWMTRAKALLAKGWTIRRAAEEVGMSASKVSEALRGHSRAEEIRLAEADARLRRFARLVKGGLSRREAGERVGYAVNSAQMAAQRAVRKGYL